MAFPGPNTPKRLPPRPSWGPLQPLARLTAKFGLAAALDVKGPGAATRLREGVAQTLTVQTLRLPAPFRRGLRTTKAIEALNSPLRATVRRVSHFTTGDQALPGRPWRRCAPSLASIGSRATAISRYWRRPWKSTSTGWTTSRRE